MQLRETGPADLESILAVGRSAFGRDEEAELTAALLDDPTAQPCVSLLAVAEDSVPAGHVLFTRARIEDHDTCSAMLLAPLAVVPERQGQGVGMALTEAGLEIARIRGTELVFVLGHPDYYRRFGFTPAAEQIGFTPPYPIEPENRDAWMVLELKPGAADRAGGRVLPAAALLRPEYWVE